MPATNPEAARLEALNRVSLQAVSNEYSQALAGVRGYLAALDVAREHGNAANLPSPAADDVFVNFARIIASQAAPTMRRVADDNRAKIVGGGA